MLLTKDFFGLLWILLFSSLQRLQGKEVFTDHRVYAVCSSDLFAALFRHLSPYFCPYGLTLIQTDHTSALFPDFVIRLNWPAIIFILYIKFYSEFIITQFFRLHRTGLRMLQKKALSYAPTMYFNQCNFTSLSESRSAEKEIIINIRNGINLKKITD